MKIFPNQSECRGAHAAAFSEPCAEREGEEEQRGVGGGKHMLLAGGFRTDSPGPPIYPHELLPLRPVCFPANRDEL